MLAEDVPRAAQIMREIETLTRFLKAAMLVAPYKVDLEARPAYGDTHQVAQLPGPFARRAIEEYLRELRLTATGLGVKFPEGSGT